MQNSYFIEHIIVPSPPPLPPSFCWELDFEKGPVADDKNMEEIFARGMSKILWLVNTLSSNLNTMNSKTFPTMVEYIAS